MGHLYAADHGHTEMVKFLVEHGADITAEDNYAVEWAAENSYIEMVRLLIENDATIYAGHNYFSSS